jgi:hypothetical protein
LHNSSFDILSSTSSPNRRAEDPSFGHYQSLACSGCCLHLKVQSHQEFPVDWQLGNYRGLKIFKLSQSGKIREVNFAAERGPGILWISETLGSANTRLLVIKV